jgi:hypothetical protein
MSTHRYVHHVVIVVRRLEEHHIAHAHRFIQPGMMRDPSETYGVQFI